MKINTVTYQKAFVIGPYLQHRIGIEIQLDEGEKPDHVLDIAKGIVDGWHRANAPEEVLTSQQGPPIIADIREPEEDRVFTIIRDINTCKDLKVLETYKFIAKSNERIQNAYNIMLNRLSNGSANQEHMPGY